MRFIERCDNCASEGWTVYGATVESKALHHVQCLCAKCGLVFANPRATESELKAFYEQYYFNWAREHFDPQWEERKFNSCKNHIKEIARYVKSGRLLEIGAGTGAFLKAASDAGFEPYGVELSPQAVTYAKSKFGIENISNCTIEEANYPSGYFDVIYAWHVIEHVSDLDRFVKELHRVVKPHGVLYLGTESYFHSTTTLTRLACFLTGRIPRIVTSSDHTFVFHPVTLKDCLERRGFDVVKITGYDELTLAERISVKSSPSRVRQVMIGGIALLAPIPNRLLRAGPYLKAIAVKEA